MADTGVCRRAAIRGAGAHGGSSVEIGHQLDDAGGGAIRVAVARASFTPEVFRASLNSWTIPRSQVLRCRWRQRDQVVDPLRKKGSGTDSPGSRARRSDVHHCSR